MTGRASDADSDETSASGPSRCRRICNRHSRSRSGRTPCCPGLSLRGSNRRSTRPPLRCRIPRPRSVCSSSSSRPCRCRPTRRRSAAASARARPAAAASARARPAAAAWGMARATASARRPRRCHRRQNRCRRRRNRHSRSRSGRTPCCPGLGLRGSNRRNTRRPRRCRIPRPRSACSSSSSRPSRFRPTHRRSAAASCLLYTSPSPRDATLSRMPSSA